MQLILLQFNTDTALVSKLNAVSEAVKSIDKKISVNPWVPVVATIAGIFIGMLTQYIDRKARNRQEIKKEINALYANCEKLLFLIKAALKDLSTQKNLSEFWLHSHYRESQNETGDENLSIRYYDDCVKYSERAIVANAKIMELLADYYSDLSKYKILTAYNINITAVENMLTKTDFEKAEKIDIELDSTQAREKYYDNNKALSTIYFKQCKSLDEINRNLLRFVTNKKIKKNGNS